MSESKAESSQIVVFESQKEPVIYNREEFIDLVEHKEKCDYSSVILIKNFPEVELFQKYILRGVCHYRPLKGSVKDFTNNILGGVDLKYTGYEVDSNILGKGSFAEVIQYGDSPVAVKISTKSHKDIEAILEYSLMSNLTNDCVNRGYDIKVGDGEVAIYMEKMDNDIRPFITSEERNPRINKQILYQICKGIYNAHSHGVIHRDLKPANVLFRRLSNDHVKVQVADWGLSRYFPYIKITKILILTSELYLIELQKFGKEKNIMTMLVIFFVLE